jgi:hypothetical protein
MYSEAYLEGIRLFNEEHFWHAHEEWEACWHASDEPDATFYKGIIQAAAALEHWKRGNPRGLRRNWEKSRGKLDSLPAMHLGIDLDAFKTAMEAFIATQHEAAIPPIPPRIALLDMARDAS